MRLWRGPWLVLAFCAALGSPAGAQQARLDAPPAAEIGARIAVDWSLTQQPPPESADFLAVARPDDPPAESATHAWPQPDGSASLRLPLQPGAWELRYVADRPGAAPQVLAARPLALHDRAVTLQAPEQVGAGDGLTVTHDGPALGADYLTVAAPDSPDDAYLGYAYVGKAGAVEIVAPLAPGRYELRYVASGNVERVLGRRSLQVAAQPVRLSAPQAALAGSLLPVEWSGPQNRLDYLEVARPGAPPGTARADAYTRGGSPLGIVLPLDPGAYEIRFVSNIGDRPEVLASRPLQVLEARASLEAPAAAVQGSRLAVAWQGPANRGDFIAVARPEAPARDSAAYAFAEPGAPAALTLPLQPGGYELRYVARGTPERILARQPLQIAAAEVALQAPAEARGGDTLTLAWQGPANPGDRLTLARPGDPPQAALAFARLQPGASARLTLPPQPGAYELRYLAAGRPAAILARRPLRVEPAGASLRAEAEAVEGTLLSVAWQGPADPGDRIGLAAPGAPPGELLAWAAVTPPGGRAAGAGGAGSSEGEPGAAGLGEVVQSGAGSGAAGHGEAGLGEAGQGGVEPGAAGSDGAAGRLLLPLPAGPGGYELRYLAAGRPPAVLARQPLRLTAAEASLEAPAEVGQGAVLSVDFAGPAGPRDRLEIAGPGAPAGAGVTGSGPLRAGRPAQIAAPLQPGAYRLRYLLGAGPKVLAEQPLQVAAVPAALSAADPAPAGADLEIAWQGPGGARDLIVLARPGAPPDEALARSRLRPGAPARLPLPLQAGRYELRYLLAGADPQAPPLVLARRPLLLIPARAQLQAPSEAAAGGRLAVDWQGPGAAQDYLALFAPGEAAPRARAWVLAGTPLTLPLPEEPGRYELAYVSGRGEVVLARQPLLLR